MKKACYVLFACTTMLTVAAQKIEDNKFPFTDGVTYSIKRFNNAKTTQYGMAPTIILISHKAAGLRPHGSSLSIREPTRKLILSKCTL